jgi:hypothetical protein
MKRVYLGLMGAIIAVAASIAALSPAVAAGTPIVTKWHTQALVSLTLTPNYNTGFGAVAAVFGTQPAATHGPGATGVGTGSVDFGTALAGKTYLYKYAAHLHVVTNDASGFLVYGEAAANFVNTTDGTSLPISQALFYLNSGATTDSNTGFSPALPFQATGALVTGGGDSISTPASITYSSFPNPIAQSSTDDADFFYDYQFKVPPTATAGNYFVWIVYTVVAR